MTVKVRIESDNNSYWNTWKGVLNVPQIDKVSDRFRFIFRNSMDKLVTLYPSKQIV